jgi:hypothetical protein
MLSSLQTQHVSRFRGGNIRIKNNPGFLTKITKGAFNSIITIEIANINNILFLPMLHIYLDSIIRIYQDPSTTDVPYDKIAELCANAATATASSFSSSSLSAAGAGAATTAVDRRPVSESTIDSFAQDFRTEAVVGDTHPSDKEESIELMAEIVPVASIKRPSITAPLVFGFEAEVQKEEEIDLFDLLQDDDDDDDTGSDAVGSSQGGGAGGAAAATAAASAGDDEDLSDITGMELANPNPFSKRIQERDPVIHLNEDVGKFNAYSRSCPWNVRRQPVILTSEEKARIDREHPDSYSHSITYGSDPSKQYHYICPRYWSLKHNTSLTEDEVKSGKYGSVIPQKAKKIPPGANVFEFTDDKYHVDDKGNYKQHYPGFLKKDAHPKGLCVPCCFAQWDKPSQTSRRKECEATGAAAAAAAERVASIGPGQAHPPSAESMMESVAEVVAPPPSSSEPVKINEMKDDRILGSDKFPLENNRWGYLPTQVQKFLFTDSRNCQVSLKNTALKKDTPCLLRRGVETNDHQSFVSAIAYYYKEGIGLETATVTTSVTGMAKLTKQSMRDSVASSISKATEGHGALSGAGGGVISLKERIAKTIAESIQKQSAQISATAASTATAASANTPDPESEHDYNSDDDTPLAMTPRPSAAAAAAVTPRAQSEQPSYAAVPTIREMRNIIIQSLNIDLFITLQNGTLTDVFYNPNKEVIDTSSYNTAKISRTVPAETFARMCNAYENFISYLDDDSSIIDHTYLWDIVSRPNEKLFKNGNNIILIHIPDDDITNNVQVVCPTNAYSGEVFDINRKTIILMKRDVYYEPIYLFESKTNGKFSVLGRFAMKSKTLMPKIRHIIENIRDLYFSYCRLNASQPREYKYKMNQPAAVIAKIVKESGFEINAQVLNFNGKVIGLQISQAITVTRLNPSAVVKKSSTRKMWKGVIPTAVSAPLPAYPMILMDDDAELWTMSYHETVEFLETVARHVMKVAKKPIFCRTKVKVVEDGLVVGVITETNQFIQVNIDKDPQLNQDDGIPTITESNHLVADKEIAMTSEGSADKTRERYVRNIRLETNFYNVFRNTARNILNRPENKAVKDDIEKMIASPFTIYSNKLSQIIAHMKRMLAKYVAFIRYSKATLKMVGKISGCITSDDETCGKKSYCLKEAGGFCKLLIPQRNLMYPEIDNEIAYFGKLSDEMIRYERVKLFMFEPTKYISFQDIKYDLHDDEIILLETFITQEYFENMEPADANPYVFQTNFYTVAPSSAGNRGLQTYDPVYRKDYVDRYLELESGIAAAVGPVTPPAAASTVPEASEEAPAVPAEAVASALRLNEINHALDFCREVSKRKITEKMRQVFFPKMNTFEILFSNESNECSFDVILTILRITAQTASKCPSGHSCVRQKQQSFAFKGDAAGSAGALEPESDLCQKCRTSIGHDQTEFACRECNYFVCEHCRTQHVDELAEMSIHKLKSILVTEYGKLSEKGLEKKLTMILNGYGMKKYADIVNEGRATLPQIIQSENYFLTNIDIWIIAVYFKIPIVFISQSLLSENGRNMMVLYGDDMTDSYFYVHPFSVTQDVPSRFGLIEVKVAADVSVLKLPLDFVSPDLQEMIRRDENESLEEYIRTFKLGNIKHKHRVFTMTGSVTAPPAGAGAAPADIGKLIAMTQMSDKASLFN